MAGKAAKLAKGGYGGGRPAYGFRASGGALEPHPNEQVILETVRARRSAGGSYREIAKALSSAGLTTRSGGPWNPNQVRRIAQKAGMA